MAQLTIEEKIKRIELAPKEMQVMVAKAFLREDIDDEDVQYLFNEDGLDILASDDTIIENQDAEEVTEGIGATDFTIRTGKPGAGNKCYIRTANDGWNTCIKGNPTDANCNVLANCVGYAQGRFNEIYNEIKGTTGNKYNTLNCNAENWIERAEKAGLKTGLTPKRGAIMCWQKGSLASSDGAGHVAIVEKVYDNNKVYTSESGYGSSAFWNSTRSNSNGRWGLGSAYTFRCFIYNPAVEDEEITPTVARDEYKDQLKTIDVMNVRTGIETSSNSLGTVPSGSIFNYYAEQQGSSSKWYAINAEMTQWIAGVNNNGHKYCEIMPGKKAESAEVPATVIPEPTTVAPTPTPAASTLKVGDSVKIIGTGNGSSYGKSNTAYGIGWTRQILKIYENRAYPYQVGNNKGTTGFYKAEALQKK